MQQEQVLTGLPYTSIESISNCKSHRRLHILFTEWFYLQRDPSFTPISFEPVDMKIIKLMTDPGLPEIKLYTGTRTFDTGKEDGNTRLGLSLVGDVEET